MNYSSYRVENRLWSSLLGGESGKKQKTSRVGGEGLTLSCRDDGALLDQSGTLWVSYNLICFLWVASSRHIQIAD